MSVTVLCQCPTRRGRSNAGFEQGKPALVEKVHLLEEHPGFLLLELADEESYHDTELRAYLKERGLILCRSHLKQEKGKPYFLTEEEVEKFLSPNEKGYDMVIEDLVTIVEGTFQGYEGHVVEMSEDLVKVRINLGNTSVTVKIDQGYVRKKA